MANESEQSERETKDNGRRRPLPERVQEMQGQLLRMAAEVTGTATDQRQVKRRLLNAEAELAIAAAIEEGTEPATPQE